MAGPVLRANGGASATTSWMAGPVPRANGGASGTTSWMAGRVLRANWDASATRAWMAGAVPRANGDASATRSWKDGRAPRAAGVASATTSVVTGAVPRATGGGELGHVVDGRKRNHSNAGDDMPTTIARRAHNHAMNRPRRNRCGSSDRRCRPRFVRPSVRRAGYRQPLSGRPGTRSDGWLVVRPGDAGASPRFASAMSECADSVALAAASNEGVAVEGRRYDDVIGR